MYHIKRLYNNILKQYKSFLEDLLKIIIEWEIILKVRILLLLHMDMEYMQLIC